MTRARAAFGLARQPPDALQQWRAAGGEHHLRGRRPEFFQRASARA